MKVNFRMTLNFSGGSSKRTKKKAKKVVRLVEKKIPKTDDEIDKFIADGRQARFLNHFFYYVNRDFVSKICW